MNMNRSRILIIALLLITAVLGGAAIWIGWRLSQEEEVTPEDSWAYPGQGACGAFIAYCSGPGNCDVTQYNSSLITCNTATDCCTFSAAPSCSGALIYGFWCLTDPGGGACLDNRHDFNVSAPGRTVCPDFYGGICGSYPCWIQLDADFSDDTTSQGTTTQGTTLLTTTQGTTSQGTTTRQTTRRTTQRTTQNLTTTTETTQLTTALTTGSSTGQSTTTGLTTELTTGLTTGITTSTTTLPGTGIFDSAKQKAVLGVALLVCGFAIYITGVGEKSMAIISVIPKNMSSKFFPKPDAKKKKVESELISKVSENDTSE